mgnify:CR=1 FL=1
MIYIHWLILFLYVMAVVASILTVVMDNRQPAKTMAWVLVLVFLPLIGILLYFFFGQNTRKEKMISQNSMDQLTKRSMLEFAEQKNLRLPEEYDSLIKLFTAQSWALPFKDNEVDIFTDGYHLFHALLQDISKAQRHIHLDTYIFNDDALGNMMADALIAKAKEGVEVRVIYDAVGCWSVSRTFFERMREEGIEVHAFMPVKFPAFTGKVNYRNHRKICVIDGLVGYIGGMNIATRYIQGKRKRVPLKLSPQGFIYKHIAWRDTHLRIRGGSVYGLQRAFLVDWYFVDRTLITSRRYYPEYDDTRKNDCLIQIVSSSPISPWPDIMQGYVRIILQAKKYVYMATPYFLPTEPVLFAMRTAALGGVDVQLMIPAKTDARLVEWASKSYLSEILEARVKVLLYKEGFNHSKLLVSDDMLSTCGSTNVDFRSFENNFEGNAFIYDAAVAQRMKAVFLEDALHCEVLDEKSAVAESSFLQRLWEGVIRLFSPLL